MTTLVLGGTGKTGRRIVSLLTRRGLPVRAGSRAARPPFAWTDPRTWDAALAGVDAVYLSYYPDLALPGAAETIAAFVARAGARGVRRLVLLSGRGEPRALASEETVRRSGLSWTVVRPSWFNQNFSEGFLLDAVLAGELALPVGEAAEPFTDADDIAEVAVAALTDERHAGQTYELTGPRLLTFAEAAAEIGAACGRPIGFVPLRPAEFTAVLREHGMPEDLGDLFHLVTDGRNAHLTDGVQRALGRPPRDFADYARAAAATGVWDVALR
ncbi:NAD(P)H-binding protein [Actinoplanes sp. NPDC049599]|uniref:NAD(P)H-binding protein n=1 Tax=Actinoplanes sp. NPDC049599 TaxID=3363903 RepID=UPI0037A9A759